MYYINSFFIYSFFGFIFECLICLFTGNAISSGILFGPITMIYGIGVILIIIISKYFFLNLHLPRYIETIIVFFILIIILTFLELISGLLIERIFGIVFWDYSSFKYNIGHYISLEVSLVWGILSIILIYLVKSRIDKLIKKIPKTITYLFIGIFTIDFIVTMITRLS